MEWMEKELHYVVEVGKPSDQVNEVYHATHDEANSPPLMTPSTNMHNFVS